MWRRFGRLDVPSGGRDLSSGQAAALLHQLGEVPVGGEHQPHEEAGLSRRTEEDDHHQVAQARPAAALQVRPTGPPLSSFRGTVHQSFPDFTFLTGNWIGRLMKLKGEIDPELAINLCNRATLAFLQRHLGKLHHTRPADADQADGLPPAGLDRNFDQWDPLIDGQDENLIEGTNITLLQSAI